MSAKDGYATAMTAQSPPGKADAEGLVLEHLGAGYNLARWFLRNPHDAEDAVQDACIRALQGMAGYAGGSGKAWFLTIVRNVCLTRMRRTASSPKVVRLDDVVTQIDQQSALDTSHVAPGRPDRQLFSKLDVARVTQAIARLPEGFREMIVLREIEELSYQEIAAIAGVPIGTVMSRLSRARERLKVLLAADREGRQDEL